MKLKMRLILQLLFLSVCVLEVAIVTDAAASTKEKMLRHGTDCTACHKLNAAEASEILKPLQVKVKEIKYSPIKGLFEILAEKNGVESSVFVDYGKKFFMQGLVVDAKQHTIASAFPAKPIAGNSSNQLDIKTIPIRQSIVIGNPDGVKKLYVFTDPDCPYCRTLHAEMLKLINKRSDIAIHILLFPQSSHPEAYDKSRFLVANKQLKYLNMAFIGKKTPKPSGDKGRLELADIASFAYKNKLAGTPTIILPTGKMILGVKDADTLSKVVDER